MKKNRKIKGKASCGMSSQVKDKSHSSQVEARQVNLGP